VSVAKWAPREGSPADRAHWDAIRAQPGFGTAWKNIKVQPTAAEQIGALRKALEEAKTTHAAELAEVRAAAGKEIGVFSRRIVELKAELKNARAAR